MKDRAPQAIGLSWPCDNTVVRQLLLSVTQGVYGYRRIRTLPARRRPHTRKGAIGEKVWCKDGVERRRKRCPPVLELISQTVPLALVQRDSITKKTSIDDSS